GHGITPLRGTERLLDLPYLLVRAKPRTVRLDGAIRMLDGRFNGVRVSGQIEHAERLRPRGLHLDVTNLSGGATQAGSLSGVLLFLLSAPLILTVPSALLVPFFLTPTILRSVSVPLLALLRAAKRSALGGNRLVRVRDLPRQFRHFVARGRRLFLLPLGGGQRCASGRVVPGARGLIPLLARCCCRIVHRLLRHRLVLLEPSHLRLQAGDLSPELVTACHAFSIPCP